MMFNNTNKQLQNAREENRTIHVMARDTVSKTGEVFKAWEEVQIINRDVDTFLVVNSKGDRLITKSFNIMELVDNCAY